MIAVHRNTATALAKNIYGFGSDFPYTLGKRGRRLRGFFGSRRLLPFWRNRRLYRCVFRGVSLFADSYGLAAREIRNNAVAKHRVKAYIVKRQIHYLLMSLRNDKAGIYSVAG